MASPAFQFYPDDFLGSPKVAVMTPQEIGVYVLLLCMDWNGVGFVHNAKLLARYCRMTESEFETAWDVVQHCFEERGGRWYNPRLERERVKQAEFRSRQSAAGKASAAARLSQRSTDVEPALKFPSPSPSPSPVTTQLPTTPLLPQPPAKATGGGWPAAIAEEWTRRVGVIREGRVGKDLQPFVRLYPDPAAAQAAVVKAVGIYADLCTRRSQKPAWPDFVRGVPGFVPATLLPPERAA